MSRKLTYLAVGLAVLIPAGLPMGARAQDSCALLRRVASLDGDYSSITGPDVRDDLGGRAATVKFDPGAGCTVLGEKGQALFACMWIDLAEDVAPADRIRVISERQAARAEQLKAMVRACYPAAPVDVKTSNAVSTAFALPKAYVIVGSPAGPGAGLMIVPRTE